MPARAVMPDLIRHPLAVDSGGFAVNKLFVESVLTIFFKKKPFFS
jgi:hypothetical protein